MIFTRIIILIFLILTIQTGLAQKTNRGMRIKDNDSINLVFFSNPLVAIQFHDPKQWEVMDYNATITAATIMREIFLQNSFELSESIVSKIDSVDIINNSKIAEKLIIKTEDASTLQEDLSLLADRYNERYICFLIQNGFYSSEDLEKIIIKSNNRTEIIAHNYNGMNTYEIFFVSASLMNIIVWDNLKDEEFLNVMDERWYRINVPIFEKQSIEWQLKKLIRRLNRSIRKKSNA